MVVALCRERRLTSPDRDEHSFPSYVSGLSLSWHPSYPGPAENHVARAEAYFIANNDNQYLVPTSGNPIRGLIQDHVVAGVWMTSQDSFFTREEYNQLLYGALRPEDDGDSNTRLITLPPTIWKPKPLWTGKQIVSDDAHSGSCC